MRNNSLLALACQNVEKSFNIQRQTNALSLLFGRPYCGPSVQALRNISLSVNGGEILGVIGRNGAGKSTLLRVLAGVYSPTSGKISLDGQVQGLFELGGMGNRFLTGREYAVRFLQLMGVSRRKLAPILQDIHDFSELGDAFERSIHTYSSGMQARLYFAVATSLKTEIYLVDELLSVGDEHFQSKCWLRIREMLAGGASGVLVTHDWTAVLKLCRSTVVLREGTIDFFGPSDQAVVKYLNIPLPDGDIACFLNETPAIQKAKATGTTSIRAWVEIKKELPVEIAMSIEILRIGVGWEIVTITKPSQISRTPGRYCVTYIIDNTPFVPGEYSLNLFLSYRDSDNEKVACDVRSWTYGNGLALLVEGDAGEVAATLPFEVAGDIAE